MSVGELASEVQLVGRDAEGWGGWDGWEECTSDDEGGEEEEEEEEGTSQRVKEILLRYSS